MLFPWFGGNQTPGKVRVGLGKARGIEKRVVVKGVANMEGFSARESWPSHSFSTHPLQNR